jgi:hypothetical protein
MNWNPCGSCGNTLRRLTTGFNYFGGRIISDGVVIEPPTTLGFTALAARMKLPDFRRVSLGAYNGTAARFAAFGPACH